MSIPRTAKFTIAALETKITSRCICSVVPTAQYGIHRLKHAIMQIRSPETVRLVAFQKHQHPQQVLRLPYSQQPPQNQYQQIGQKLHQRQDQKLQQHEGRKLQQEYWKQQLFAPSNQQRVLNPLKQLQCNRLFLSRCQATLLLHVLRLPQIKVCLFARQVSAGIQNCAMYSISALKSRMRIRIWTSWCSNAPMVPSIRNLLVVVPSPSPMTNAAKRNSCVRSWWRMSILRTWQVPAILYATNHQTNVYLFPQLQIQSTLPLCPEEGHFSVNQEECSELFIKCNYYRQRGRIEGHIHRCPQGFIFWNVSQRCEPARKLGNCTPTKYNVDDGVPLEWINIGHRRRNLRI